MSLRRPFEEWLELRAAELAEADCDLCGGTGNWGSACHFEACSNDASCSFCGGTDFVLCVCVCDAIIPKAGIGGNMMNYLRAEYLRQFRRESRLYHECLVPTIA